ncbi:hypothetical protein FJT64_016869 [Amphibalanus amphitrite]|uniref:Uncharacterized protein n=1 Tax=Amphibalanus amphitrite TaxID=1232801 RepID=A0A6A4XDD7_AMPAM|nr:hypothetical protein FJT64_016869 [Amphibalanus amphitrite]
MGARHSSPPVSDEQADATCELLVAMLQSREAARLARGFTGRFAASSFGLKVLRLAEGQPAPQCACADLSQLIVERVYSSGSIPEGNDVRLREPFGSSDADVMFQLGPVRVADLSEQRPDGLNQSETAGSSYNDATEGHQETAGRPGFVLLHHQRRPQCRHRERLLFSAGSAVRLLADLGREAADGRPGRLDRAGPSLAVNFWDQYHIDLVACVRCPSWPSAEFAGRQRPSGWPPADLVRRLCRMGVLLVPVGARGTKAERHQWRLSFSQLEHTALRALTPEQRACLTALKYCKAALGRSVAAVKSYYLKTAVLWLSERHGADWWAGPGAARRALLAVLSWVEAAARAGRLPCYFWSEVDALGGRSWAERRRLVRHVAALRRHLLAAGVVLCGSRLVQWQRQGAMPADLAPLVSRLGSQDPASAAQLRPTDYRAVLRGNNITLDQLRELTQGEAIWPDEQTITIPPVSMNNLLSGYLLVNNGPRGVTCPASLPPPGRRSHGASARRAKLRRQ